MQRLIQNRVGWTGLMSNQEQEIAQSRAENITTQTQLETNNTVDWEQTVYTGGRNAGRLASRFVSSISAETNNFAFVRAEHSFTDPRNGKKDFLLYLGIQLAHDASLNANAQKTNQTYYPYRFLQTALVDLTMSDILTDDDLAAIQTIAVGIVGNALPNETILASMLHSQSTSTSLRDPYTALQTEIERSICGHTEDTTAFASVRDRVTNIKNGASDKPIERISSINQGLNS